MNYENTLSKIGSPHLHFKVCDENDLTWTAKHRLSFGGRFYVRTLRGFKMQTRAGLMSEFGAALQFFKGFGENWHALLDCLRNLHFEERREGYVLEIIDAHLLLIDEGGTPDWLLDVLNEAGCYYNEKIEDGDIFDRPALPFHAIFSFPSKEEMMAFSKRVSKSLDMVSR